MGASADGLKRVATEPDPAVGANATWRFARYLVAYRGNLSREEAARRSGLPVVLWTKIETTRGSDPEGEPVPAAIVAAMCAAVGADVFTGLTLAGHQPEEYAHLVEQPPVFTALTRDTRSITGPYIATPHVVIAALTAPYAAHEQIAAVYRYLAHSNGEVADQIAENPPDSRAEYWSGYVDAIRTVAEQQAWAAEQEAVRHASSS